MIRVTLLPNWWFLRQTFHMIQVIIDLNWNYYLTWIKLLTLSSMGHYKVLVFGQVYIRYICGQTQFCCNVMSVKDAILNCSWTFNSYKVKDFTFFWWMFIFAGNQVFFMVYCYMKVWVCYYDLLLCFHTPIIYVLICMFVFSFLIFVLWRSQ